MKFEKTEQIGNVTIKHINKNQTKDLKFKNRSIEYKLYQLFKSNPNYNHDSNSIKFVSGLQEYHLSPVHHNLLKWYTFNPNGEVLEVGSNFGALTGLFCSKLKHIVVFENSYQRGLITAHRYSQCSNLEVIVGDFQNYVNDRQFDYITLIGVLEYSEKFYSDKGSFTIFLKRLREMLKPDGELILAMENKNTVKDINKVQTNHKGQILNSANNDFRNDKLIAFSKKEITFLLESYGFSSLDWYYPLPDYKLPQVILSNEEKLDITDSSWKLFPAKIDAFQQKGILSKKLHEKPYAAAELCDEFATSFLVIAKNGERSNKFRCLRFYGANYKRKPQYRTNVRLCFVKNKKEVVKCADNSNADKTIMEIANREVIAKKYFDGKATVVTGRLEDISLYYPYIDYPSFEKLIVRKIEEGELDFGKSLIDAYLKFLYSLPTETCIPRKFINEFKIPSQEISCPVECLSFAPIDCVPRNIKVGPKNWFIIDHEWTMDFPLPIDYLLFRAIALLVIDLQSTIQMHVSKQRPVTLFWGYGKNRVYIPISWLEILNNTSFPLNMLLRWELQFQNKVHIHRRNMRLRLKRNPRAVTKVKYREVILGNTKHGHLYSKLKK